MAHDSEGQIFIGNTGVEIADLQQVLGRATGDLGQLCSDQEWYDTGNLDGLGNPIYALRPVNRINKWAKYKPVRYDKLGILTDAERVEANHGLKMTKYTSPSALVAGFANEYAYLPPRGNPTYGEWFRLRDFDGYNHNAQSPVQSFECPSGDVTENQDIIVRLYLNPSNQVPTGSLTWADIDPDIESHPISQYYYFGVIIRTGTSSTYQVITMDTPVGTGVPIQELALTLPASLFSVGTSYTVYPIFSYTAYTTASSASSYVTGLYAVPDATPQTFTITTIARVVSVGITDFSATVGAGRYTWSLTGAMQVNGTTTITGRIDYRIYDGQYDPLSGTFSGQVIASGEFYNGQIPVAPGQAVHTETGTKMGTTPQYLTAVLSYQGTDYLPVTIEVGIE